MDFDKYSFYLEAMKDYLASQEISFDKDKIGALTKEILNENNVVIKGLNYELDKSLLFLAPLGRKVELSKIKKALNEELDNKKIVILIESISDKLNVAFKETKTVKIHFVFVKKNQDDRYKIGIDTRLNSMLIKPSECKDVFPVGQIFVARLYDIVAMYNSYGDVLFEKNVRYSLEKDKNGVEKAIKETLTSEPENFWFYNNGITLIANEIDCSDNKSIVIVSDNENRFSVINGAQTLKASANFFYASDAEKEVKDKAKNAYVMLRIITVHCATDNDENKKKKRRLESRISISLNRQKPIDEEDLAFNMDLVSIINDYKIDDELKFNINRKGEQGDDKTYTLTEVAKYRLASHNQKPGSAINLYKDYALKTKNEKFVNNDALFDIKEDDIQEYVDNYGMINISNKLYKIIQDYYANNILGDEIDNSVKCMLNNGAYYFVSIISKILFLNNSTNVNKISKDKIIKITNMLEDSDTKELVKTYEMFVKDTLKDNGEEINYAKLKKDTTYGIFVKSSYYERFCGQVENFFELGTKLQ